MHHQYGEQKKIGEQTLRDLESAHQWQDPCDHDYQIEFDGKAMTHAPLTHFRDYSNCADYLENGTTHP